MTTFTLCPECSHAKRRHNQYGCTADTSNGSCLCNRAADEILDNATITMPDVETFPEPVTTPDATVETREPATPTVPEVEVRQPPLIPAEDILARAQAAGGKLATRADRIRAMVTALGSDLAEWERVADQERRIQELRRQLEEATAVLRDLRGQPKPATQVPAAVDDNLPTDKQLRHWAAQAGVPCGSVGKVGAKVIAAWRAAGSPNLDSEVAA